MILFGKMQVYKSKWLWGYVLVLVISILDWLVTVSLGCDEVRKTIIIWLFKILYSAWLVDKGSVKTHIRTVVRIFRIWTGVPDVVYLAGSFKLCIVVFLDVSPLQTCVSLKFTDKNFIDY